ncbi:MAG: single-stranded-DNA-specific exonuclease RecJ [Chthoniobacterales bacterium]
MQRRWVFPRPVDPLRVRQFQRDLAVPSFIAEWLLRRGLENNEQADGFLHPRLKTLGDPFTLPGMRQAVDRIDAALRRKEKIVLYGDYDVDGVASLALLTRFLRAFGASVECFLPVRADEGYGLSPAGLRRCFEDYSPTLLIAMDCGTNAVDEIAEIRRLGVDVIVLDHHEPQPTLPDCVAIVNPKCGSDYEYLCSAGVTFKLCHAILKNTPSADIDLKDYLDLVALATLADLVPLVGENRILVSRGLKQMASTRWPGLCALMEVSGVKAPVKGGDVGFRLGPRINASGRLGTALESLKLLLTDNPVEARNIALNLDLQNRERQTVERAVAIEAEKRVTDDYDPAKMRSIVLGETNWHQGVLGIVASRITKRWHRPSLVIGFDEEGFGKGSGRSIEGFSLVEALGRCSHLLDKFGGHQMAAGLTLRRESFEEFRTTFEKVSEEMLNDEMLTRSLHLDGELSLSEVDETLLQGLEMLEPFGMDNLQPMLVARGVAPSAAPAVLKEKHLRFEFTEGRRRVTAMYFDGALEKLPHPPWDIAFRIERNDFRGRSTPQIYVSDVRSSTGAGAVPLS